MELVAFSQIFSRIVHFGLQNTCAGKKHLCQSLCRLLYMTVISLRLSDLSTVGEALFNPRHFT